MGKDCSTEFSSAAEIYSSYKSRAVRDLYSLLTSKQNQKLRDKQKASRIEQYRSLVKNDKFASSIKPSS